ncbi:MAG: hypothetical protein ACRDM1_02870 [Gaiellaceae bacterium]
MPWWGWVLIGLGILAVVVGIAWRAFAARRTRGLQQRFGPEYDRTAESAGSHRRAEAELSARQDRREQLDIRPLPAETRQRYAGQWETVQTQFVDSPAAAVAAADSLVSSVMASRGYPMDDFDQRAADVSVDHPQVVENYRHAHTISLSSAGGSATTEDLRRAMQDYRALFDELLGDDAADQPVARDRAEVGRDDGSRATSTSTSRRGAN